MGTLCDYWKEFEKLGNRVQGWTQKALVDTFMGGLKVKNSEGIRMFKSKTLKEVIRIARKRNDQLALPALAQSVSTSPVKRLMWDEMQKQQAQGLCFYYNEKFTVGDECQGPQLLLLEESINTREIVYEEIIDAMLEEATPKLQDIIIYFDQMVNKFEKDATWENKTTLGTRIPSKGEGMTNHEFPTICIRNRNGVKVFRVV